MRKSLLGGLLLSGAFMVSAQEAPENWFNLDFEKDSVRGVSTERAYEELLKDKKGQEIIVAVIDGGVDPYHEDLKRVMWVNEDEIPNNGKDDDNNGYVDDIYGWNFIGGFDGDSVTHVNHDNLESTRVYAMYLSEYGDVKKKSKAENKEEFEMFTEAKESFEESLLGAYERLVGLNQLYTNLEANADSLKGLLGVEEITAESLEEFETEDEKLQRLVGAYSYYFRAHSYFQGQVDYYYNPVFSPRSIIGDDYTDLTNRIYGNHDIKGPDASHGTHVAGIIAADRTNDIGMKGVANNVKIMGIRVVPDGDERDKDVANAVYYAVDNGAKIINMSFGKSFSPYKSYVDKAFKYAEEKGVLLVHAAGNSHLNIDKHTHYPCDKMKDEEHTFTTWLDIGASDWRSDDTHFVADFSNYGKEIVDIFAPGVDIYATFPDNEYESISGTSMATPVVSGVAALVWSYNPNLTAVQLREILLKSGTDYAKKKVNLPGSRRTDKKSGEKVADMVRMDKISVTGKIVNAYEALKLAETYK